MDAFVVVLVNATVLAVTASWLLPGAASRVAASFVVAGLAGIGLVAVLHGHLADASSVLTGWLLVAFSLLAVLGGGPVTAMVLWLVDRNDRPGPAGRADGLEGAAAGEVLRGGAWIGVFERAAVFAALVAGWPEGLAVVLALKGLGRYSELRADASSSGGLGVVAERFTIGSFSSLLWACASAGGFVSLAG